MHGRIVFADADLDEAAQGVTVGIFANQGEVCAADSRILVARSVYTEFLERLVARARATRVGDPFDEGTTMGALIDARQLGRVCEHIADETALACARFQGARLARFATLLAG
ncbi:aldehyde dehydrogenase family protein [Streptomyces ossamyceticus]|nr:aldehyde dehydrogenase family protein [Streptomyces ossamyceticus]